MDGIHIRGPNSVMCTGYPGFFSQWQGQAYASFLLSVTLNPWHRSGKGGGSRSSADEGWVFDGWGMGMWLGWGRACCAELRH